MAFIKLMVSDNDYLDGQHEVLLHIDAIDYAQEWTTEDGEIVTYIKVAQGDEFFTVESLETLEERILSAEHVSKADVVEIRSALARLASSLKEEDALL